MIDVPETLELLERAVREKGADYVYDPGEDERGFANMCRYVEPDGTPSCIVGWALSYEGLLDGITAETEGYPEFLPQVRRNFTAPAIEVLREAQNAQDRGDTWGNALKAARFEV